MSWRTGAEHHAASLWQRPTTTQAVRPCVRTRRLRPEASVTIELAPRCPPTTLLRSHHTSNAFLELAGRVGVVADWSFLTNHARVMLCIARDPDARLRDIASTLGITERSAYGIVTDLAAAEYA